MKTNQNICMNTNGDAKNVIMRANFKKRMSGLLMAVVGMVLLALAIDSLSPSTQEFHRSVAAPVKQLQPVQNIVTNVVWPLAFFALGAAFLGYGGFCLLVGLPKEVANDIRDEYKNAELLRAREPSEDLTKPEDQIRHDGIYYRESGDDYCDCKYFSTDGKVWMTSECTTRKPIGVFKAITRGASIRNIKLNEGDFTNDGSTATFCYKLEDSLSIEGTCKFQDGNLLISTSCSNGFKSENRYEFLEIIV